MSEKLPNRNPDRCVAKRLGVQHPSRSASITAERIGPLMIQNLLIIPLDNSRDNNYHEFVMESTRKAIKQDKPFGSKQEAAFLAVVMLAEDLESEFSDLFKKRNLTAAQYNVLRILRGAGEDGHSCSEIGARMITRDSDITRMLDRLEARELIRRERQSDDRRVVLTFITGTGKELLAEFDKPVHELHKRQLADLSEKELDKLISLLEKARRQRK